MHGDNDVSLKWMGMRGSSDVRIKLSGMCGNSDVRVKWDVHDGSDVYEGACLVALMSV